MRTDIYWIAASWRGRLGIASRPRGGDWLADEMAAWREIGVDSVVSLLTDDEVVELELRNEEEECRARGIRFRSLPIKDRGLPSSRDDIDAIVGELEAELSAGRSVLIHCRQGIGRSSLLAASTLVRSGEDPDRALARIEAARGRPVPDTEEQRRWVAEFAG
jgi:protein-tyrosine phosphatase